MALIKDCQSALTTAKRERPIDRFQPDALRCLPAITPDYRRHRRGALVHKDMRLQFDGNRYCVPHRFRRPPSRHLKADSSSVTIYDRVQEIVSYLRVRGRSAARPLRAERFEAERWPEFRPRRPAVARPRTGCSPFFGGLCSKATLEAYLRDIADSDRSTVAPDHRTA